MITLTGVAKRYGAILALDGLTLTIPEGAVFGLLGPNGAGKSTLIRLLLGFIFPDAGRVDLGKLSPPDIGYVPERPFFPARCRVDEYLLTAGRLSGLRGTPLRQAVASRLEQVGLSQAARWQINAYSKGMLQRLALALALLSDPPLLVLDEPMAGLDPLWQKATRDIIRIARDEGQTVLFSTHRLSDIADLCTHVGILHRGKLMRYGNLDQVLPLRQQVTITVEELPVPVQAQLAALGPGVGVQKDAVTLGGEAVALKRQVLELLLRAGLDIQGLAQERTTLEEVYLEAIRP